MIYIGQDICSRPNFCLFFSPLVVQLVNILIASEGPRVSQQVPQKAQTSVLLAEDNVVNQRVAAALLATIGCQVSICNNGREAVQAVIDGDFDLVLMDIQMPVLDGMAATGEIRALADPAKARIPILALTANMRDEDVSRYLACGMNDVLGKPLRIDKIKQWIAAHVATHVVPHVVPHVAAPKSAKLSEENLLDHAQIGALREALNPEKFTELFNLARNSLLQSSEALRAAWTSDDRAEIKSAAHRLAGVARNFGCAALGNNAAEIERAAIAGGDGLDHENDFNRLLTASLAALPGSSERP
jgi:CheY-like chemotaxis protein/HPt (histidine-containing phosphotransfer) domain-containing protein